MSGLDPDKMKLICKGHVIDDGKCWFSFVKYATSFTQKITVIESSTAPRAIIICLSAITFNNYY